MSEDLIFPDSEEFDPDDIVFFYFECKRCGERWFSTFCQCPGCKRVRKFRILDIDLYREQLAINELFSDRIHYVFLNGGE